MRPGASLYNREELPPLQVLDWIRDVNQRRILLGILAFLFSAGERCSLPVDIWFSTLRSLGVGRATAFVEL
jgi:hypothetical protein